VVSITGGLLPRTGSRWWCPQRLVSPMDQIPATRWPAWHCPPAGGLTVCVCACLLDETRTAFRALVRPPLFGYSHYQLAFKEN